MKDDVLARFADGVWLDSGPVSIVGMPMRSTMTVLSLDDGGVLVHSPVALTPERRAAVLALGPVRHLYAPNTFHHTWIGEWSAAFPDARLHAPRGLRAKRPDLRIDREHGTPLDPSLARAIHEVRIQGFDLEESALVHLPARTAVVADLVHNVGRPTQLWAQLYTKAAGFYDRVAISRTLRWLAFSDRRAVRRSVDALIGEPFDRLVLGHGAPLPEEARDALADAYRWLAP